MNDLEKLIKEYVTLTEAGRPQIAPVGRNIARQLGGEYLASSKKIAGRTLRIFFENPPSDQELEKAIQSTVGPLKLYTPLRMNSTASGKYHSARFVSEDDLWDAHIVAVTRKPQVGKGGTAGPGENEIVDAINDAVKIHQNPITVKMGGITWQDVTGARKPERKEAKGGEPKIDVLILTGDGEPHPHGGLSLKAGLNVSGAPTYEGWSRITKILAKEEPAVEKELVEFVTDYIEEFRLVQQEDGFYKYNGINAWRSCSDEVAKFALYGNKSTAGAGIDSAHHLVEVVSQPDSIVTEQGVDLQGFVAHPESWMPPEGNGWQPVWLLRGANGRRSMGVNNARLAIVPYYRAKSGTKI